MTRRTLSRGLGAAAVVTLGLVLLTIGISEERDPPAAENGSLTERLGGVERYLTHVSTDKPIYRSGETVYVRGVVLRANDRRPLEDAESAALVEIKGPKGDRVAQGWSRIQDSVVGFAWKVPQELAGGEYTVKVSHPATGHAPAERKFDVRSYRAPRLKSQIVFVRDGYRPGDVVAASCRVERAEGGVPTGATVTVLGRVDGATVHESKAQVGPDGICSARFELPEEIARGEGTLAFVIEDGGIVETTSKTIPILLQTIDLQMYPEGGELVAGLENRLYIAAQTPAKKPADLAGEIVDRRGEIVAEFRTEHEGRGRVTFTPEQGESYLLRITEPSGIRKRYPLPEIKASGVVLRSRGDVIEERQPVRLQVASTQPQTLRVTLSQREKVRATRTLRLRGGEPVEMKLDPGDADGVLIATVWDRSGRPLAERLVFRQPQESIQVTITPDRESYIPGEEAALTIETKDGRGRPVSAVVGVTVTDDSVQEMIEKREQAPRLPVMVLLEPEVQELADAHVYLDESNPQAPLAVDLLLGTQGWRRFALVKMTDFVAQHGDDARRALALKLASRVEREQAERARFFFAEPAGLAGLGAPMPARAPAAPEAAAAAQPDGGEQADAIQLDLAEAAPPALEELEAALEDAQVAQQEKLIDGRFRKRMAVMQPADFVIVREYAHQVRRSREPGERRDFTETLYWNAGIRTDETTGRATVRFGLNDAVTSFRVMADAFTSGGALGAGTAAIESVEPFYTEPKLPLEVTSGDVIQLPLGIVNSTPEMLSEARVTVEAPHLPDVEIAPFTLPGNARERRLVRIPVGGFSGSTSLTLRAAAGPYQDTVSRELQVEPLGFPVQIAHGGMLDPNESVTREVRIPDHVVSRSLTASVTVFPTPLANMTEALQALIREPSGCFEQASSTVYPLAMAQQYFLSHTGVDPALVERSNEMLAKGYERLTGYECTERGYEWFGADPGHEALTAYGLMEFRDMSQVYHVDSGMLERTRGWLLKQRDGEGGFRRERRALHTWVVEPEVANAYITWALLSAGERGLDREVAWVKDAAARTSNSYVLALAANVLLLAGDDEGAKTLTKRLTNLQSSEGDVQGATTSVVGSGGEALAIETTALATLAWLRDEEHSDAALKGVRYLTSMCKAGRFGSTQSTVLALKAIVEQDKALAHPKADGSLQLLVDGRPVGEPVAFDASTHGAIRLPDAAELLTPGTHTLALRMIDGSSMPFAMAVDLHSTKPASAEECKVRLAVSLSDQEVNEGAVTEARVVVTNIAKEAAPTPVAIIGLPGGLEVRHDQLKELVRAGHIAAYEVRGREVILYWRSLEPEQKIELPLSLLAAIPGSYTGPASRTYLYYTDEHKQWADPLKVEIEPLAE